MEVNMRNFLTDLLLAAILAVVVGGLLLLAYEREVAREHAVMVCEPTIDGRPAGLYSGVHTHRVKGLGRKDSKAVKIRTCEALGFNPTNR
jgi:hypothetical protein